MTRVIASVALFIGVLALFDMVLTGGHNVDQLSRLILRVL
jgi:hypothetical protein